MGKKNISFLFGAGISIDAGLPNGVKLTDKIKKEFYDNCREVYINANYNDPRRNFSIKGEDFIALYKYIIELIENEFNCYKMNNCVNQFNYEDLIYFAKSIKDYFDYCDNPAFGILAKQLEQKFLTSKFSGIRGLTFTKSLGHVIYSVSIGLLHKLKEHSCIDYLKVIPDTINELKENNYDVNYINTLNHDIILEEVLQKNRINYCDGFRVLNENEIIEEIVDYRNKIMIWEHKLLIENTELKLLKLHGSINWHWVVDTININETKRARTKAYFKNLDINACLENDSNREKIKFKDENIRIPNSPLILTGTFNKLFEYNSRLPLRLIHEFQNCLDKTDILVVSGYSFGDFGINQRIIDWMVVNPDAKIVIFSIENDLNDFTEKTKGGIKEDFELFNHNSNRIKYNSGGIKAMSYSQIIDFE